MLQTSFVKTVGLLFLIIGVSLFFFSMTAEQVADLFQNQEEFKIKFVDTLLDDNHYQKLSKQYRNLAKKPPSKEVLRERLLTDENKFFSSLPSSEKINQYASSVFLTSIVLITAGLAAILLGNLKDIMNTFYYFSLAGTLSGAISLALMLNIPTMVLNSTGSSLGLPSKDLLFKEILQAFLRSNTIIVIIVTGASLLVFAIIHFIKK